MAKSFRFNEDHEETAADYRDRREQRRNKRHSRDTAFVVIEEPETPAFMYAAAFAPVNGGMYA